MLNMDQHHLRKFQQIKKRFYSATKIPEFGNWMKRSNNEIWLEFVAQVVVVGSSAPWAKLIANPEFKSKISWENLSKIQNLDKLKITINEVLLAAGTRYASSDLSKSAKARALAYNMGKLKEYKNGPKEFLSKLSELQVQFSDKLRIKCVICNLQYIKNKGARDLLMELGLITNAVALDVRVLKILENVGIKVPEGSLSNPKLYDEIENAILTEICSPLRLLGVELDRMVYQNYEGILAMLS